MTFVLGAVAYDTKVVTIWNGFRVFFDRNDFPFDYVLYSHYERQVEDLVAGRIDVAWNSPLAWIRADRLARAAGSRVEALAMRDTDRDLRSLIVVRADSGITEVAQLADATVGTGAVDSPQATLLPLSLLRKHGLTPGKNFAVRRFDVGVGLHGDHIGGEREAAQALINGKIDAVCMLDATHLQLIRGGMFSPSATRILAETDAFDHCNMTVSPAADPAESARFRDLLIGMSYEDASLRPLMDLEGLKAWHAGRTTGYKSLDIAVDEAGFYGKDGELLDRDYRP